MILNGHEDLHPKPIVGFDMGFALVQCGDDIKRYRMTIDPAGGLRAEPLTEEPPTAVDQLATAVTTPQQEARARRFHDVDQPIT